MIHLGDVPASTTIYIPFTTYGKTNGESITCSGLAVTDVEIYKNGSTTQRSSDAGIALLDTDGIDFDGITGLHGFSIDLSNNTDSGFYAVGSWYWVVVSAITVDSQTVTFLAATFRIGPAEALTGHPKVDVGGWLGTAPATPTVNGVPEVDVTHWLGTAPATPTVAGVPEVDVTYINGSAATGSGTPDVNVVSISGDTTAADNAEAFFDGTGYAGTNNVIPAVTTVNGLAANVVTAASLAADAVAEIQSGLATQASVNTIDDFLDTEIAAILADTNELQTDWANGGRLDLILDARSSQTSVDTIDDFLDTEIAAIKAKTDNLPTDPADQSAVEAAITSATSPLATAASLATVAGYLDTEIAAILADTNELQTDWANGGRLDLILDARSSQTSVDDLPTNAELATALGTADDAILTRLGTPAGASVSADIAATKAETATIVADTNELQADWANGGRLDLLLDSALAAALLARQILGNKHTVTADSPSPGLHTIAVRNDADDATVRTIVYNPATGARTVS